MSEKVSRARRQALMARGLREAGRAVVAMLDLPYCPDDLKLTTDEASFLDEYIRSIGERLIEQGERRSPEAQRAARRYVRAVR